MKDCMGNELQVGDTVCYIGSGGLIKGRVIETVKRVSLKRHYWQKETSTPSITDRVVVERPAWYGDGTSMQRVNLTQPGNVVKIPA